MPAYRAVPHDDPRQWYQLERWRKRAKHQLIIEPLCVFCLADGINTPATIADHVAPHKGDWNAFRTGALQSLCKHHHDQAKQRLERDGYDRTIGLDGMPTDGNHPVYRAR